MLPGLIDTHVHLVADSGFGALDRIAGLPTDEIDAVITEGLRRQLAAGVTTVRDLGDRRFGVWSGVTGNAPAQRPSRNRPSWPPVRR